MREFYLSNPNEGFSGPYELEDAINKCKVLVPEKRKKQILDDYVKGNAYEWWIVYGFNSALITVWPDKHK